MQEGEWRERRGRREEGRERMTIKDEMGKDQDLTDQNCKRIVFLVPTNVMHVCKTT